MHVAESVVNIAKRGTAHLGKKACEERTLSIRITNATRKKLRNTGNFVCAGTLDSSFTELLPGQVGRLRFNSGEGGFIMNVASMCHHGGATAFAIGEETLVIAQAHKIGYSAGMEPALSVEIVPGRHGSLKQVMSKLQPGFHGSSEDNSWVRGICCRAKVHAVCSEFRTDVDIRLVEGEETIYEYDLRSLEQLDFAEWCCREYPTHVGACVFLLEWAGMTRVLTHASLGDTAHGLDLLITTYVLSGILDVSLQPLEYELLRWRVTKKPSRLRPSTSKESKSGLLALAYYGGREGAAEAESLFGPETLDEYHVYASLPDASDESLGEYCDVGRSILTMIALECTQRLQDALLEFQSELTSNAWSKRSITPDDLDDLDFAKAETDASARKATHLDLRPYLRSCIQSSATFSTRREKLLDVFAQQQSSEKLQTLFAKYRSRTALSVRNFTVARPNSPPIHLQSYHCSAFTTLNDGRLTSGDMLVESLGLEAEEYEVMNHCAPPGEFCFFSADRRFLMKSIDAKEGKRLNKFTAMYHEHIRSRPKSLLVRIAGLYRAEVRGYAPVHFIVMANVFDPTHGVESVFGLKGASHGRHKGGGEDCATDEEWLAENRCLKLPAGARRELCAVHEADLRLLSSQKMVDYTLLIGVRARQPEEATSWGWKEDGCLHDLDGGSVLHIGITDISIKYGLTKQTQNLIKLAKGGSIDESSWLTQDTYAKRQVAFMREKVCEAVPEHLDHGTLGLLTVHLKSAHKLVAADWCGTSDPYVTVTLGLNSRQTVAVKRTCSPTFGITVHLPVNEDHLEDAVDISVWDADENKAFRGSDDFLGRCKVPIRKLVKLGKAEFENAKLSDVAHGCISMTVEYTPLPEYPWKLSRKTDRAMIKDLTRLSLFLTYWSLLPEEAQHGFCEEKQKEQEPEQEDPFLHFREALRSVEESPQSAPSSTSTKPAICKGCECSFSMRRFRYHCKQCDQVYCSSCLKEKVTISEPGHVPRTLSVCSSCAKHHREQQSRDENPCDNGANSPSSSCTALTASSKGRCKAKPSLMSFGFNSAVKSAFPSQAQALLA